MELFVLGLNHDTASIDLRERLFFPERELPKALDALGEVPELAERMILTTCNRVEVYGVAEGPLSQTVESVVACLGRHRSLDPAQFDGAFYTHTAAAAARHVFRVASSLESMVLGEPQILGQVKSAYSIARAEQSTGIVLNNLLEQAFHVAKRVRTETGIASVPVSIASVAVDLARKIFGDLAGRTVLILGAGEMAELALRHLMDDGVQSILVANRTYERAVALAEQFRGRAVTYDSFQREMLHADIVISATSAPHMILEKEDMQRIIQERRHRPIFLIDIADPRDIDAACNEVDNVYLYNIDDLQSVAAANQKERQREAERAVPIVEREVELFLAWLRGLDVVPTIVSLRNRMEEIREAELRKAMSRLGDLTPEQRETIASLTTAMVNKILHQPMSELRRRAVHQDGHLYSTVLRRLFGLEEKDG
ncbi:MAG: glutamyl-tRNA reductase [candidate division NC10 bacterium]|nr:glutamyl-tRNA reductase [candidate division NC10 bacterium]